MLIYAILLIVMMIFNNSGLKNAPSGKKRAARRAGDPQKKTELSDKEEV